MMRSSLLLMWCVALGCSAEPRGFGTRVELEAGGSDAAENNPEENKPEEGDAEANQQSSGGAPTGRDDKPAGMPLPAEASSGRIAKAPEAGDDLKTKNGGAAASPLDGGAAASEAALDCRHEARACSNGFSCQKEGGRWECLAESQEAPLTPGVPMTSQDDTELPPSTTPPDGVTPTTPPSVPPAGPAPDPVSEELPPVEPPAVVPLPAPEEPPAICGNGKREGAELCDDGDTLSNGEGACLADCSGVQECGNGTREGNESCDLEPNCPPGCRRFATQVSAGDSHSCAVIEGGSVQCWGHGSDGQLGDGGSSYQATPVDVVGLGGKAQSVAAGDKHTCALLASGGVQCWGDNFAGELGDGTTTSSPNPVSVVGLSSGVVELSVHSNHACVLTTAGGVKCWGRALFGGLGHGKSTSSSVPVDVVGLSSGVTAISAGNSHSCAVLATGAAMCWGDNRDGQVGNKAMAYGEEEPVDVASIDGRFRDIAAGGYFTCAIREDGAVYCWGDNTKGQLAASTTVEYSTSPRAVPALRGALEVTTGQNFACALLSEGDVQCWGDNTYGQLGRVMISSSPLGPAVVDGLGGTAIAVSAGHRHACALLESGAVECWGDGDSPTQVYGIP